MVRGGKAGRCFREVPSISAECGVEEDLIARELRKNLQHPLLRHSDVARHAAGAIEEKAWRRRPFRACGIPELACGREQRRSGSGLDLLMHERHSMPLSE